MAQRVYSGRRIINALAIPTEEYADIYPGVIAVHPKWMPAVRALVASQPQMTRWLDRDILASQMMLNCNGEYGWTIHKRGRSPVLSTGFTAAHSGALAQSISSTQIHPYATVPQLTYTITHATQNFFTSIIRTDNRFFPAGANVKIDVPGEESAGVPLGNKMEFVGNGNTSYPYLGMDGGVYSYAQYEEVKWHGEGRLITPVPENTMLNWPLISGPAVCSRGEIWPRRGAKWFCASYEDVASAIELASAGLSGDARTKANQQIETLRSRPTSAMFYLDLGDHDNAWALYPETWNDADDYRRRVDTVDEIDFGAINALLDRAYEGEKFVSVMTGEERVVVGTPIEGVFPVDGVIVVTALGSPTWNGQLLPTTLVELPSYAAWVRARGSAITGVEYEGTDMGTALIAKRADDQLKQHKGPAAYFSYDADYGGVGLAAITAGMKPLTESQQGVLRSIVQPSYLDWAIENTQLI